MKWIDSHRRVDKGVTVGNCKMNHLLFADELVLHEWIFSTGSWGIMSVKTPKAVFSASERKYTAAGGNVQVPWVVFTSDESRNKGFDGLVKQTQFCVRFIAPWWRNGSCQRTQSFQFLNRSSFRSSPVVMNLSWQLKKYCQKNKRQKWDSCEELAVWLFVTDHRSEIRKACDVQPLLWIERLQLC